MNIVPFLALFSLALGAIGLAAFWWSVKSGQYEDPKGDAERILAPGDDRPL